MTDLLLYSKHFMASDLGKISRVTSSLNKTSCFIKVVTNAESMIYETGGHDLFSNFVCVTQKKLDNDHVHSFFSTIKFASFIMTALLGLLCKVRDFLMNHVTSHGIYHIMLTQHDGDSSNHKQVSHKSGCIVQIKYKDKTIF